MFDRKMWVILGVLLLLALVAGAMNVGDLLTVEPEPGGLFK